MRVRHVRIFGFSVFAAVVLLSALTAFGQRYRAQPNQQSVDVYFLDAATGQLEPEGNYIDKTGDMVAELLAVVQKGPHTTGLSKVWPDSVSMSYTLENGVLKLDFSDDYASMVPEDELYLRGSLVYTMTQLADVNALQFFTGGQEMLRGDGKPMGLMNKSVVEINPVISPSEVVTQQFVLYFANEQKTNLVKEVQSVNVNPNEPAEWYVVEQLIAGPTQDGHYAVVPPETKVRGVRTESDICYINLSKDFTDKLSTADFTTQRLAISSIVDSLTELPNVKKVQFQIESDMPDQSYGGIDLSKPIARDEGIIKN